MACWHFCRSWLTTRPGTRDSKSAHEGFRSWESHPRTSVKSTDMLLVHAHGVRMLRHDAPRTLGVSPVNLKARWRWEFRAVLHRCQINKVGIPEQALHDPVPWRCTMVLHDPLPCGLGARIHPLFVYPTRDLVSACVFSYQPPPHEAECH